MNDRKYYDYLAQKKALLDNLKREESDAQLKITECEVRKAELEKAIEVVNAVTILTLTEVKGFIEDTVSLCLSTVYGEQYKFGIDYDVKRGRSEAKVFIQKGEDKLDPKDEVGGGVIDVASIGLRLVLWLLSVPRSAPVFIFDEPFRFVSRDLTDKIVDMLREVCDVFGAQIIAVSHNEELIDGCDKTVRVSQVDGVSRVEEVV